MAPEINIGGLPVGAGHPVFVIAEAGVNHNGDLDLARELVLAAKRAGADCVKFQTFQAERIVSPCAPKAAYQLNTTDPAESQFEMLKKLELGHSAYRELIAFCRQQEILFLSTPYSEEDVDFLCDLDVAALKFASISCAEPQFLSYAASKGRPMILSTGMATLAEVDEAVRAIRGAGNDQLVLLQCTTNYPSRIEDTNLRAMVTMGRAFDSLVGYSDHTQTDTGCIVSVSLGGCVIEKHFTLDKTLPGPDQSTSLEPDEFARLVGLIRETETVLGSDRKQPADIERTNAINMRRSLVAARPIAKGDTIESDDLTLKRPATGLAPSMLDDVVGRIARRDIEAGDMLNLEDCGARPDS